MELARGQVTDRPWARTLWELGARRCTGQLTLRAEGRRYAIAFDHGAVVAAASPLASDSAIRVALTHHLIAPAQAAELTRRVAAAPGRDELEVLAEAARLPLDQARRLRRKLIEQRAARTFSIDEGELVVGSEIEIPVVTGLEVDVRGVICLGARMHLSEQRLGDELRQLGVRFTLAPRARGELGPFGFTEAEQPILEALEAGTSLAELEARHRDLDPRTVRAVIYALACCSLCTAVPGAPRAGADDAAAGRAQPHAGRDGFGSRAVAAGLRSSGSRTSVVTMSEYRMISATPPAPPTGASRPQATRAPSSGPDHPGVVRSSRAPTRPAAPRALKPPRTSTRPPASAAAGRTPTPRTAFAAGRAPTPRTTPATSRTPTPRTAPAAGRAPTLPATDRTPTPGLRRRRQTAADPAPPGPVPAPSPPDPPDPLTAAAGAFQRALSRLRVESLEEAIADLTRAVELAPNELDYAATLAWARFCHAADKQALAQTTRERLARAIRRSPTPEIARFYLGRVERMLGRDKEALRHFRQVLEVQPRHAAATAEIRAIEARVAQAAAKESGVLGRKR
jgi:hypothetical protein